MRLGAALLALWACTSMAQSRNLPILPDEFSREAHKWLSRGVVAEAGFHSRDDHAAIAYVLSRRLRMRQRTWPGASFVDVTREYMAGMGVNLRKMTRRTYYIRRLPYAMPSTHHPLSLVLDEQGWAGVIANVPQPKMWPESKAMPWSRYIMHWEQVLQFTKLWSMGGVPDKCPDAVHWGVPTGIDRQRAVDAGWKVEDCGNTKNIFYSVPRK